MCTIMYSSTKNFEVRGGKVRPQNSNCFSGRWCFSGPYITVLSFWKIFDSAQNSQGKAGWRRCVCASCTVGASFVLILPKLSSHIIHCGQYMSHTLRCHLSHHPFLIRFQIETDRENQLCQAHQILLVELAGSPCKTAVSRGDGVSPAPLVPLLSTLYGSVSAFCIFQVIFDL